MKLQSDIAPTYGKRSHIPWYTIYPLFLIHMLAFGAAGFYLAYVVDPRLRSFLYMHGGIAILTYLGAYLAIFGLDKVKWMFINAGLGALGIYSQIGWLLSLMGKKVSDYTFNVHVIPFIYYVLYTFLLRQAVLDLTNSREDPVKQKRAETFFIAFSLVVSAISYYATRR